MNKMKNISIVYKNSAKIRQNISIPKLERHLLTKNYILQSAKYPYKKQTGLRMVRSPSILFYQKNYPR